ncbi:DUF6338 family protein [Streptomyces brasiliscabiei]|uniref:DUF6338 family protein n=1 Tax=Streptomyces brasiliscabiei TaxID=2736302 RepID=A0ABU8G514_9ACTN
MPSSVVALFVLLVSAAPGYVYIRIVEVRRPRRWRSPLLELVDLVCVGAVGSAAAALSVLLLARHWTALLPLEGLLEGPAYLVGHPWQTLWSGVLATITSVCCAVAAGLVVARRDRAVVRHSPHSPMYRVVRMTPPGRALHLAVRLIDGQLWEGLLLSLDDKHDTLGEGDLVLQGPLALTEPGGERTRHPARFVAIPGSQIAFVYGTDVLLRPRVPAPGAAGTPVAVPPAVAPSGSASTPGVTGSPPASVVPVAPSPSPPLPDPSLVTPPETP